MAVRLNDNKEIVNEIREGLKHTGGYCPCRVERSDETKCICREFKEQIADPDFEGYCHCMLYYKEQSKFHIHQPKTLCRVRNSSRGFCNACKNRNPGLGISEICPHLRGIRQSSDSFILNGMKSALL